MTHNTRGFELSNQHGVLVLTPQGDSLSYRDTDLQRECAEIKSQIEAVGMQRVVVDLGRSAYFSSLMIGLISSIGQSVRRNGGQMFLCNASPEMQTVFKIMKIDTLWPVYSTLAEGVRAMKDWPDQASDAGQKSGHEGLA